MKNKNPLDGIPLIPMVNILKQYAKAKGLQLDPRRWESIIRTFNHYQIFAALKN